ncbi:MAG: tetratricopeptide repeat protein [Proteobacteria bacterium]|nr:tetratricopeptide repeat protein [Pseudomonadota bacterium]
MNITKKRLILFVMAALFSACLTISNASAQTSKYQDIATELGGGNLERGVKHLGKLAESGNGAATFLLAHMFLELGDVQKFQKYLYIAAEQKNPTAIKFLATSYFKGALGEQSFTKARDWFEKGAQLRNINSMVYLGIIYRDGLGIGVDIDKAYFWFSLAGVLKEDVAGQKEPEEFAAEIKHLVSKKTLNMTEKNIKSWLSSNPEIQPTSIPPID